MPLSLRLLALTFILCAAMGQKALADTEDKPALLVFAASSLTAAINEAASTWASSTGNAEPKISVAASAVLARQIEAGAPADIFISANDVWTKYLTHDGHLVRPPTVVARNRLILAGPKPSCCVDARPSEAELRYAIQSRFIMADPNVSPAGAYAQSALKALDLWDSAKSNAAYAGNVRLALALIERGRAPGFVYESDLKRSQLAVGLYTIPEGLHPPIAYSAAVPKKGRQPELAAQFLLWLQGERGQKILVSNGFKAR